MINYEMYTLYTSEDLMKLYSTCNYYLAGKKSA